MDQSKIIFLNNEIKDITTMNPSTVTVVGKFTTHINYEQLKWILPVEYIGYDMVLKGKKTLKLPNIPTQDCRILSLYDGKEYRGITLSNTTLTEKSKFRNSVSVYITTETKNINIKFMNMAFQISGAQSVQHATKGINSLLKVVIECQDALDQLTHEDADTVLQYYKTEKIEKDFPNCNKLSKLLANLWKDNLYTLDKMAYLVDNIKTFNIYKEVPSAIDLQSVMVNYNYSLGSYISKYNMILALNTIEGVFCRNTGESPKIIFDVPYIHGEKSNNTLKAKNKKKHHTFIIYKTGSITQSGPNIDSVQDTYNMIMSELYLHRKTFCI